MDIAELRFLIVEDQGVQRVVLVNTLEGLGARHVIAAEDGRVALELLHDRDRTVDVIISDLDMPEMDGMELIRHLGEDGGDYSLIVASALDRSILSSVEVYESRADAIGDFRMGAKPIVANCLKRSLERQLKASPLVKVSVPFARVVAAPPVGDRRIAYRIVARLKAASTQLDVYLDVIVVQRGRSIAALFFTGPKQSLPAQAQIASSVAARMR